MQRPFASTGVAPLPRYYGLIRLLLSLTLLAVLPSSLAGLSKHAAPFAPPRPRSPNRIGHEVLTSHMETCWSRGFRVNETLRRKFTCVAAYFFVRQDSRTSVALCTACPPNRMSISLRFSSFQLIVHAELCLAYLYQQALHPLDPTYTPSSRRIRNLSSVTGLVHPRAWRVPSTHPPLRMTCLADKHC